jgi:signal transduction histidine kinase
VLPGEPIELVSREVDLTGPLPSFKPALLIGERCMPDVAESNKISEKSRSDPESVRRLLDQLPLGMFEGLSDGRLVYTNGLLQRLLEGEEGLTPEVGGSLERQISGQIRDCLRSGKPTSARLRAFGNSDVFIHVFPTKDQAGEWMGAAGWVEGLSGMTDLQSKLEKKIHELSILCELSRVLSSTLNLEEILQIILIGVTAGQGLGFNRAFLLLLNQARTMLEGKLAIGPSNSEEANRIWESLSAREQSLEEVLRSYKDALKEKDVLVNQTVKKLKIPLSDERNPLIRSIINRRAYNVTGERPRADEDFRRLLLTEQFAVAPLMFKDKVLGVILADNMITKKAIEDEDVELLSICAHHASAAIESSQLYQEVAEKVGKLAEASRRIAESNQRLLKVEKLSVLGQITSQVAHELRNPMTIIGGFANSILKKMDAKASDYEYVKIIAEETHRMENVLNNVLNFSKPDRAHLEMVDLNELVEQTFEMMEPEIDSTKIWFFRLPFEELSPVRANADLIRQALLNVFRNAIWAMPQGGILLVSTKQTDEFARIEVKDTGFGIPHRHLGKIFDAFFTTKPEACGLGLTLSSEIIRNHGGKIRVESAEGKGATLHIELPLARDQASAKPEESESESVKQGGESEEERIRRRVSTQAGTGRLIGQGDHIGGG